MFWRYACNHFLLDRDGVRTEYQALGPTVKDEAEWRREFISLWQSKLSVDDLAPLSNLRNSWATESIPRIIDLAEVGDGYAQLFFANALWHLSESESLAKATRDAARKVANRIWRRLASEPVHISDAHRSEISPQALLALGAGTAEEYVRNYAHKQVGKHGLH
jgi:hypothetical protein